MARQTLEHERRYVGTKETIAYVLFDSSKSFNISSYDTRFFLDVVKINFAWNAIGSTVGGIWDVINDTFAGFLVDRTKTRWGKFKPYLLAFALPGTIMTILRWLTPYFFDANPQNVPKFFFWIVSGMVNELMTTFRGFAETGFVSSISPNPNDRVRMFTTAEVLSSLWESFPGIAMGVIVDMVNRGRVDFSMQSVYLWMGTICALQAGALTFLYASVCKERILQSQEKPSVRDGLKTIFNNRPMMLLMLSDLMKSFKMDTGTQNYYMDVLGYASISNIIILPGAPLSMLSYLYVPWAQRKFSTKALWIFGDHERDITGILVFLFGIIGGTGRNGFYRKVACMLPALMVKDMIYKGTLGIFKIVPRTLQTEALDYCEWKNGYRTEGTTLAAKSVVQKLAGITMKPVNNLLLQQIGYSLKVGYGQQSVRTQYLLFATCTLLPGLSGLLGIIPKLFYEMSLENREKMYEELSVRRVQQHKAIQERQDAGEYV